jgi:hypothetical protein
LSCHDPPLGESDKALWCNRDAELTEKIVNLADFKGLRSIGGRENPRVVGNSYKLGQLFPCSKDLRKNLPKGTAGDEHEETPRLLEILRCRIHTIN